MTTYRVDFERVGRNHSVDPLTVTVADGDELAEKIHKYANRHLASRWFLVSVDLETGEGWIEAGRFGTFKVVEVEGLDGA